MLELTPRLSAVASYVAPGSVIADIGTDHAFIPCYLIAQDIISEAFACDINKGPLANARASALQYNIEGIRFILSDGLQQLACEQFDTIVIAGMGGELIASILDAAPWCRKEAYTFILQPMTKADYLRRYLYENGFEIVNEKFAAEKDKLYTVMRVKYCGASQSIDEAFALLGKGTNDPLFEKKRQREIRRLRKILQSLAHKEGSDAQMRHIKALIEEIEVYSC